MDKLTFCTKIGPIFDHEFSLKRSSSSLSFWILRTLKKKLSFSLSEEHTP
ncbi:hypothetical protein CCACVL1_03777 [Corchorus capsularis]|uniref:Uncharacterized protein n=1 Tax=Corchorus capsularis TaxID=210143 RepID=A0A1R3JX98_COCAP|nr:hypothetical protein CCACVL1_03777 [Corchorus capsularis]